MGDICQFIESLGGLHDGQVVGLQWLPATSRFELVIEDLYANFDGLAEYKGPARATFVFSQVSELSINANLSERGLLVYEWIIRKSGSEGYSSELRFSPSGIISINCGAIECDESDDLGSK